MNSTCHIDSILNIPLRFGFNGQEMDKEITDAIGANLDFGAREYDSRIGRFWSLDPKYREFPDISPYCYAYNNPIIFIDIFGEKGTIYIQVMKDKNGKALVDKKTRDQIKLDLEQKMHALGIDVKVTIVVSNSILTKEDFYSKDVRKDADPVDSYVLIGKGEQLDAVWDNTIPFPKQNLVPVEPSVQIKNNNGWERSFSLPCEVQGTSSHNDKLAYINIEKLGRAMASDKFNLYDLVKQIRLAAEHETGHPKFAYYKGNWNGKTTSVIGHVPGTVMDVDNPNEKYEEGMIKMLQEIHGEYPPPDKNGSFPSSTHGVSPPK